MEKKIVILGAGKIGRGFAADVFMAGGYKPIFVDSSEALIENLREQGYYTIVKLRSKTEQIKERVEDFETMHLSEESLPEVIRRTGLMAVSVFVDVFGDVADLVAKVLEQKYELGDETPLNILVLANVDAPQAKLQKEIESRLSKQIRFFSEKVLAVVGSIVVCTAVQPQKEHLEEDPLVVVTDGHPILPVGDGFKGERPTSSRLTFHSDMEMLEKRKLRTYNMAHAVTSYIGFTRGYEYVADALADPDIESVVRGALEEVTEGYEKAYGQDPEEMKSLRDSIVLKFKNPALKDTIARVGGNPIRKLGPTDRIVGSALFAYENGIWPEHLLKGAAYGLKFAPEGDVAADTIQENLKTYGVDATIRKFMGLSDEDMIETVKREYEKAGVQE